MCFYPGGFSGGNAQERYLETSSTQAAFSLSAAVHRVAVAPTGPGGIILAAAPHHRIISMGRERGLRFTPFGKGADTATFSYKLWLAKFELNSKGAPAFAQLRLAVTGAVALSSGLVRPTDSALLNASELRGDVISGTADAAWTSFNDANGGSLEIGLHTPNNNLDDAVLTIPDIFDHDGVLMEMDLTGATEANWLFERTR